MLKKKNLVEIAFAPGSRRASPISQLRATAADFISWRRRAMSLFSCSGSKASDKLPRINDESGCRLLLLVIKNTPSSAKSEILWYFFSSKLQSRFTLRTSRGNRVSFFHVPLDSLIYLPKETVSGVFQRLALNEYVAVGDFQRGNILPFFFF